MSISKLDSNNTSARYRTIEGSKGRVVVDVKLARQAMREAMKRHKLRRQANAEYQTVLKGDGTR